jgi:hypothetical protein
MPVNFHFGSIAGSLGSECQIRCKLITYSNVLLGFIIIFVLSWFVGAGRTAFFPVTAQFPTGEGREGVGIPACAALSTVIYDAPVHAKGIPIFTAEIKLPRGMEREDPFRMNLCQTPYQWVRASRGSRVRSKLLTLASVSG